MKATAKRAQRRHTVGRQKSAYLFLLPAALILAVFVFVPLLSSLGLSLLNIDIFMKDVSFAGLDNFARMIGDDRVWGATINTLVFTVLEVPMQVGLALVLATYVSRSSIWRRLLRSAYYIPFVCSMTAMSIVWSLILDPNMGMLPHWLRQIGLGSIGFLKDPALALPTIVGITAWKGFGYTLTILCAGVLNISPSMFEAAEIDGAGVLARFRHVTIPEIWPTICFCIVTTTILSLQVFDQAYIMTRGGPNFATETLVQYIYDRGFQTAPYNLGYSSSIAVYLFAIIAIVTFVLRRFVLERDNGVE